MFIRPYAPIGPRRGKRKEARGKTKRKRQRQRQRGWAERQEANLPGRPGRINKNFPVTTGRERGLTLTIEGGRQRETTT